MQRSERVVLVHGAWHGGWVWDDVAERLRRDGIAVDVVELPGLGRTAGDHSLAGHAKHLADVVAASDVPTVVVAHSYGGAVATQARRAPNVSRMVFLAAFMLTTGESCMSVNDSTEGSSSGDAAFDVDGDYIRMPRAAAAAAFYNDVPETLATASIDRMVLEHRSTVYAPMSRVGWAAASSSYVVCIRDEAIIPAIQRRMAARAETRYELDAGHSAMISRPGGVAAIILAECARVA